MEGNGLWLRESRVQPKRVDFFERDWGTRRIWTTDFKTARAIELLFSWLKRCLRDRRRPLFSRLRSVGVALTAVLVAGGCSKESPTSDSPSAKPNAAAVPFESTKKMADQGDAAAQNILGELCLKGQGVRQDSKVAAEWFRKSADQGHAPAEFNLGTLYEAGQGVPFDYASAAEWYRKSAERGHAGAQYSLAVMYVYARGVARNDPEALKWLTRAAEQGEPMAAYAMGERYRNGTGVLLDLAEAYKWFSVAANQNVSDAATALKEIKAKMTSDQIAEGRKRMQQFSPKHTATNSPK
jgi:hypothetical protein